MICVLEIYFLKTSTDNGSICFRNFNAVDWDAMLPPKLKPCESTWEVSPDPISQQGNVFAKRYEAISDLTQVSFLSFLHIFTHLDPMSNTGFKHADANQLYFICVF